MITVMLDARAHPDQVEFIPGFLDEDDTRPAREQLDAHYLGGWMPMTGFQRRGYVLTYPGDPPMKPLAMMVLRNEMILIYPHAFVMIMQPGGDFEVARMD